MKRACLSLALVTAFLGSCASDPSKPPVPTAYEIEQMKRYERDKQEDELSWR